LSKRLPQQRVSFETGLFGDLTGNIARFHKAKFAARVVASKS
jgi:hypothetical protein